MFCILFPCWDHGSEIPSGKVTWVPPTSLALSPAPLLSPDDCGLLFSEAKNQPHNLKNCVFSSLLFQMEIMWIFQHNTGIRTTAGRPPGLSSCPVSEHKLIANCSTCPSETLICHEHKQISCHGFSLLSCTKRMMMHISFVEKISDDWEMTSEFLLLLRKTFS